MEKKKNNKDKTSLEQQVSPSVDSVGGTFDYEDFCERPPYSSEGYFVAGGSVVNGKGKTVGYVTRDYFGNADKVVILDDYLR